MIGTLLKTMQRPAQIAGLGAMQDFLVAGFSAFKAMGGAQDFLRILIERETDLMREIYEGVELPVDPDAPTALRTPPA